MSHNNDDFIETTAVVLSGGNSLSVTRESLNELAEKRKLLKDFVREQLVEGIDNDYAVIPGTKKKTLLQPGAEKLCQLFGLRPEFELVFKEIDFETNFVMFSYKCRIIHIQSGKIIAENDAICNSQETKYAEKTEWTERTATSPAVKNKVAQKISEVINTVMMMCQKRAYVNATKKAVGASDFFTSDMEKKEIQKLNTADQAHESKGNISFSVDGKKEDTTASKDTLKQFGGKWNPGISKWVFNNVTQEVMDQVNALPGLKAIKS